MRRGAISKLPVGLGVGLIGIAGSLPAIIDATQKDFPQLAQSYAWLPGLFTAAEVSLGAAGLISLAFYPFMLFDMSDQLQLAKMRLGAWMLGTLDATIAYEVAFARATDLPDLRQSILSEDDRSRHLAAEEGEKMERAQPQYFSHPGASRE